MAVNRNILFMLIGALIVGVGVLGYALSGKERAERRPDQPRARRPKDRQEIRRTRQVPKRKFRRAAAIAEPSGS